MTVSATAGPALHADSHEGASRLTRAGLVALVAIAAAACSAWVAAAVVSSGHGFDATDEGFYLLSYRWWETEPRTFTGVQYVYGPWFEALGYDPAALRLLRLATVVAATLALGFATAWWWRPRRPAALDTVWWDAAVVLVVLASGAMVYGWLPLSPGYNDVTALGSLMLVAVVLGLAGHVDRGRRPAWWLPLAAGPVVVTMLLAKWSSAALVVLAAAVVGVVVLVPAGPRALARTTGLALLGVVASVAVVQLVVVDLRAVVPTMLEVNALIAESTSSPRALLGLYLDSGAELMATVLRLYWPLLLVAAASGLVRSSPWNHLVLGLAVVAVGLSVVQVVHSQGWLGGTVNLDRYTVTAVLLILVVALVWASTSVRGLGETQRPRSASRWLRTAAVVGLLLTAPVLQAAGTGNPLHYMAVNAFACWAVVAVIAWTRSSREPPAARLLLAAVLVAVVLLPTAVAVDGLLRHPYRTSPVAESTATPTGVPPLESLRLTPDLAQAYTTLSEDLGDLVEQPGRRILAFDERAGVVFALQGRSVGEAWYSASDPARTAAGIEAACDEGPPWGDDLPVLLSTRGLTSTDTDALTSCGVDVDRQYEPLPSTGAEALGLEVLVPRGVPDDQGEQAPAVESGGSPPP